MMARIFRLLWCVIGFAGSSSHAQTIQWFSALGANNITSSGAPMTHAFRFELGAFKTGFVPSLSNKPQWAANWVCAQSETYNLSNNQYAGQYDFAIQDNTALIPQGAAVYVWGFQGGVTSSEWILFRKSDWTWPAVSSPMDPAKQWHPTALGMMVIIGTLNTVNAQNNPVLMKSESVTDAASPPTTWQQWQTNELAGAPLNEPHDDPDRDGVPNMMEFVFGTPPGQPGAPPATPVERVTVSGQQYLQITIPRRIDHAALLTVEVSPDLTNWYSGPSYTTVVSNLPVALVVRDLTPMGPGVAKRFMRLQAGISTP